MKLTDKNSIYEAMKAGRKIFALGVLARATADKKVAEIVRLAEELGIPMRELPNVNPDRRSGERLPVIEARCADYEYVYLDDIRESVMAAGKKALIVALDHVQDPHNLGAMLRTAAAAKANGVIIEKKRCCDVTDSVYEISRGGADNVPIVMVSNLRNALQELKKWGLWVAGADERAEKDCFSEDLAGAHVLALGSEGDGLSRLIREECDFLVRVPTAEAFPSLNVSVAAGVLIFEALRQKKNYETGRKPERKAR
ncbi:MAG: 23S rRNA (guanosine(2251)-2'-O)-methyltransferase RlmB [bacterium]